MLNVPSIWGAAGLTASAGIAGWVEMLLLRSTLNERIGRTGLPIAYVATLWGSAAIAAALAWGAKVAVGTLHPVVTATIVLGVYGVVFIGATLALRVPEPLTALAPLLPSSSK